MNLRSTKRHQTDTTIVTTIVPTAHCSIAIIDTYQKVYSDQTGPFPIKSYRGYRYIVIMLHCQTNAILAQPIKNKTQQELTRAISHLHKILQTQGFTVTTHIIDNEAPQSLIDTLNYQHIAHQKVPPYIHRRNAAERAICTFKNHFISSLSSLPPNFPLYLWCQLLPQAVLMLNLLRTSMQCPHLSAHAHLFGNYNFDATPIAPPRSTIIVHQKPSQRTSWNPHGRQATT
jgi:hypothetical protein